MSEDRQMRASEGVIDVSSLMFRLKGDSARADRTRLDIIWAPVERRSLAEKADASSKAGDTLPLEAKLTEVWQFHPAKARRYAEQLRTEQASALAVEPATT